MKNEKMTTKDILQYHAKFLEFRQTYWIKISHSLSKIIAEDCSEDNFADVSEISIVKGILSCVLHMINLKANRVNKKLDAVKILIQQEEEEDE